MSLRDPHTLSLRNPGLPPEEVDTLLRNFFRAEMPDPWPVLKAPATEPFRQERRPASRWTPIRSRMALAASVALLLLGSWCFSAKSPDYSKPSQDGSGTSYGSPARPWEKDRIKSPNKTQSNTNAPDSGGCWPK
jgi:hypothetical protein